MQDRVFRNQSTRQPSLCGGRLCVGNGQGLEEFIKKNLEKEQEKDKRVSLRARDNFRNVGKRVTSSGSRISESPCRFENMSFFQSFW